MKVPASIKNSRSVYKNLILTLGIMLIVLAAAELVLRGLVAVNLVPMPGIGSIHPELNVKIPLLDAYVEQNHGVDCIFLGSSMFDDSVNPKTFSKEYEKLSGRAIHCFNLSIASLTAETAYSLTAAINQKYHPELIVYGVSPRDLTSDFDAQTRPVVKEPWVNYLSGEFNISGWLKEYSFLYREYLSVLFALNPDNRTSLKTSLANIQPDGFYKVDRNLMKIGGQNFIEVWQPNLKDMRGLKRMLRMAKADSPEVILVETPVHTTFLPTYVEGSVEKYFSLFQEPMTQLAKEYNVKFIISVDPVVPFVPDEYWGDVKHLNHKGAEVFSRWLAEKIWQQIDSEYIKDPFRP